ncbi:DNA-binding MarR family transcriptional regulator [Actinoplanes tereljensis]|uniref:MarR family transcriptional regulator n=1 Tax=Paractinoplanes tereljensis TaxID=571912 RepID=A0A919NL45_9ACTN|nr:MarR family transcriptional regulator [Actinoplanes tereljensis]GIF20770.1 MarR family transcriptional regulator [Actinoplanes tereljensis]
MESVPSSDARDRRRLTNGVKQALRETTLRIAQLNHQVSGKLGLRDVDYDCLNLLNLHGPISPGALAKLAGVHPATMTGILDRLEKAGWVARDRDPADRRATVIVVHRERGGEVRALYAGPNAEMDDICAGYSPEQLATIIDFLQRAADVGLRATREL